MSGADHHPFRSPGADWIYVDEGTEYTPEQAARRFLDHPWGHQVKIMTDLLEAQGIAWACKNLGHEGAHIFATTHTCGKPAPKSAEIPVLPGQDTIDTALGAS